MRPVHRSSRSPSVRRSLARRRSVAPTLPLTSGPCRSSGCFQGSRRSDRGCDPSPRSASLLVALVRRVLLDITLAALLLRLSGHLAGMFARRRGRWLGLIAGSLWAPTRGRSEASGFP